MEFTPEILRLRLKQIMKEHGLSKNRWANMSGISESNLRAFLDEKSTRDNMTIATLTALAKSVGMTLEEIITGAVPYDVETLQKIPAYEDMRIAAGPPTELHAYQDHNEFVYFRTSRKNLRAIRIADRSYSMNRVALPGQHIIIDFDDHDPDTLDGKFVVACVNGDCTFKRWRRDPDRLEPYSDMPDQPTLYIKDFDDFRIVGKVIGVVSDFD